MRPITREEASPLIRRARAIAARTFALAGLGELRVGCTGLRIRRTNASLCHSELILTRIDAGEDRWEPDDPSPDPATVQWIKNN